MILRLSACSIAGEPLGVAALRRTLHLQSVAGALSPPDKFVCLRYTQQTISHMSLIVWPPGCSSRAGDLRALHAQCLSVCLRPAVSGERGNQLTSLVIFSVVHAEKTKKFT